MGALHTNFTDQEILSLDETCLYTESYEYRAFISYSHADDKAAAAVHRQLENFKIPKGVGRCDRSLRPIFRDRDDLSAGSGLHERLQSSLRQSENLIVLCSPNAANSHWVNEEVLYFKRLGRADRIFTVIIDGEPHAEDVSQECLPKAIRYELAQDGTLSQERAEPLAADFRDHGDGKKLGLLKLVSGLLSVKLDDLVRRDLANSRKRLAAVLASSAIIISLLGGLTLFATSAQKEASARKADAENIVEFMLSDLREDLETVGRLDLMEGIGETAAGYYSQFDASDFANDVNANGRRARALHLVGELKYSLGAIEEADDYFQRAYEITQTAASTVPLNYERVQEHAMSAYLQSKTYRSRENQSVEMGLLQEYHQLAEQLFALDPNKTEAIRHGGVAKTNLGRLSLRKGKTAMATEYLIAADELFLKLSKLSPEVSTTLSHAENLAWLAEAYRISDRLNYAHQVRQRQVDMLRNKHLRFPQDFRVTEGLVYAEIGLGNAARDIENYDSALRAHLFVLAKSDEALEMEPHREKMMRAKAAALLGLMKTSFDRRNYQACREYREKMTQLQNKPYLKSLTESLYWTEYLPKSLTDFDRKLEGVTRHYAESAAP
jgi:hypothetical protein